MSHKSRIINDSKIKRVVPTRANTPMDEWIGMLRKRLKDFPHVPKDFVSDLRAKHAWEGGDSVEGFASHIEKQVTHRARSEQIKRDNPHNYK